MIDKVKNKFSDRHLRKKIPFLGFIYDKIVQFITPRYIKISGFVIYLDPIDSLGLFRNQSHEEIEQLIIIKNEVNKGNVVLDIGANIGFHTLLLARQVGEEGKYLLLNRPPKALPC